ncbi:hypothetical protein NW752_008357 [Fusarium irregulare]|uniref:Uncharacterized protein n=1 Tax=Fusarium irregulare TaxID=2494466 RepID=A0A9W8PWX7_9HYPO|nr:hypothetical protein NW752_008357 [Fusarium irregulare]KAJ4019405.1 hypothetical protein NW766_003124 [Fusarium irregulare]
MHHDRSPVFSKGREFHFLPVTTTHPSNRRETELRHASARSYLAKSMHRSKKKNTDDIQGALIPIDGSTGTRWQPTLLCTVPDRIVDQHTKMLLHYCTQSFWPGFEVGSAAFHIPSFASDYNTLMSQGPALIHALLWSAAVSLSYRRKAKVTDKGSLMHYNQALKHISQDISRPIAEIPEQTLYAILSVTGPEVSLDDGEGIVRRAFDPPLKELAWIHVYGRRLHIDAHATALMRIVDLKGGIHNLKSSEFQASFNYMDLTRATQKLIRPHLPVSRLYGRVKETHDRRQFFGYVSDLASRSYAGETSEQIDRLVGDGLTAALQEVIYDMRAWVTVIEGYHWGLLKSLDTSLLAAHRDLIQQRLLATLPDKEALIEEDIETAASINNLIQTALLIFSLGVIFPITYAPPYHRLARRLRCQLEQHVAQTSPHLLTWLGMLGVLCCEQVGNDLRGWFIQFLGIVERKRPSARAWSTTKQESLESFLWSAVSCDAAAEVAWREVQEGSRGWESTAWSGILGTICG